MHTRLSAVVIGTILASTTGASAACPLGQPRNCVDFDLVPQITQQIVAQEPATPANKLTPRAAPDTPYTGPTVGLAPGVRRAPTVGYRWALQ